ncbi:hypothetical protein FQN50_003674 [Emmonsiellopsis sp. PD_5]|nr:hypothetical protein FQN50_003674 [Emmonsiellopsis sp. PD_5]
MDTTFAPGRELRFIHSFVPILAAIYYFGASLVRGICSPKTQETSSQEKKGLRYANGCVMLLVLTTYVSIAHYFIRGPEYRFVPVAADSVALISASFSDSIPSPPQDTIVFALASALLWFTTILGYVDAKSPPGYPLYGCWLIYLVSEVLLLSFSLQLNLPRTKLSTALLAFQTIRLAILFFFPCVVFGSRLFTNKSAHGDEESTPLLSESMNGPEGATSESAYGSCDSENDTPSSVNSQSSKKTPDASENDYEQKFKELDKWAFIGNLRTLAPFFWPSGLPRLQLFKNEGVLPWKEISLFIALRLLDSGGGVQAVMKFLWVPLEDYSYKLLSTTAYNQIMTLSSDYHDSKNSGSLWQAVIRGQNVRDMVNNICFHIAPMIVDLALAVSVLYYLFDAYMALDIAAISVLFVWSSSKILSKQADKRRQFITTRSNEFTQMCESTANWHTVSYFSRTNYEKSRYSSRVGEHLASRRKFKLWDHLENTIQSLLLLLGLMIACFLAAYQVVKGSKPIGSFIMLLSYWAQLSSPLQLIATGFNGIAMDMVDLEEFLELLKLKPTVTDRPHAKTMLLDGGDIDFVDVKFSYDGKREVLRNVNFRAKSGQTTALVGQTGGGKSTILKLISRFYDPTEGVVKINGQDVSSVTLESLRSNIGIVPQSPALFHDTIMNNIRYARLNATDDEIIEACKAVDLHDRILTFTDGYDTLVGERGMKLSGGELQRVAIARVIIRNPKIVLLDEATSSVDSETEAHVQASLQRLSEGRTTFIIAHRLSTIIHADKIMVVDDGTIVEEGSHDELLNAKGHYHRLWSLQGAFGNVRHKAGRTGLLIDDLDYAETLVKNSSPTTGSLGATGSSEDIDGIASSSSESFTSGDLTTKNHTQVHEPSNQVSHGISKDSPVPKKIWKPEAPEFIPRACQEPALSTRTNQNKLVHHVFADVRPANGKCNAKPVNLAGNSNLVVGHVETSKENAPLLGSEEISQNGQFAGLSSLGNGSNEMEPVSPRKRRALEPANDTEGWGVHGVRRSDVQDTTDEPSAFAVLENNNQRIIRRKMTKSEPVNMGRDEDHGAEDESGLVSGPATQHKKATSTANQRRRRRNRNWNYKNDHRQRAAKTGTDGTGYWS